MHARGWRWSWIRSGAAAYAVASLLVVTALGACRSAPNPSPRPSPAPSSTEGRPARRATSTTPPRGASVSLTLVAERNVPPHTVVGEHRFGGISALVFRGRDRQLLALSDGRAEHGPGRLFLVDADRLIATDAVRFGPPMASQALDLEGMTRASDGTLWVATEGDGKRDPRRPPSIWRVTDDGHVLGEVPVPDQLVPTPSGELRHGVRSNKGIEGLTAPLEGGARVVAAVEQACAQDGPTATFEQGTTTRLIVYEGTTARAQHAYLTDPVPPASAAGEVTAADIGVSALAALDRDRLLVMERAGVAVDGAYTNHVRFYEVSLAGAIDVSTVDALAADAPVLAKRLVLDLDSIIPDLDPAYARLDNFEAMAFGTAPDGSLRLYVASDDNFSDDQRTALLVFAVE